jgi:hypothetical protein
MWRCWWLSRWESRSPVFEKRAICAAISRSTSSQLMPPRTVRLKNSPLVWETVPFHQPGSVRSRAPGRLALPPASDAGQHPVPGSDEPTRQLPRMHFPSQATSTRYDSVLKRPQDPSVDSGVSPKSSALTISCFKARRPEPRGFRVASSSGMQPVPESSLRSRPDWPEWRCRDFWENNLRRIARS